MSISTEIQRLQNSKTNIKAAIENKGVTVGDGTIDTYAEKIGKIAIGDYNQGYEDGKSEEYNIFWDNLQDNGTRTDYTATFGAGWNDKTYNPKYVVAPINALEMYRNSRMTKIIGVDFSNCTSLQDTFMDAKAEEISLVDCSKVARLANTFYRATNLKTLSLKVVASNVFANTFNYASAIENLSIDGVIGTSLNLSWTTVLSNDSMQNIIDCLADLTGGAAQTLTLHSTVGAKLTDTQKATITAKNWTLVY